MEVSAIPTEDGVNCEQHRVGGATVEVLSASGAAFVVITGELARAACARVLATVDELLDGGACRVVVDLSCVTSTDCGGCDLVAQLAARRAQGVTVSAGGTVRLLSALGRHQRRRRAA